MPYLRRFLRPVLGLALILFFLTLSGVAQERIRPTNRITESIDNRATVVRVGDVHPLARAEYYQRWLTPEAFGQSFGIAQADLDQIVGWLQSSGFDVEPVSPARRAVVFSG